MIRDVLILWAAAYVGLLALYFALGWALSALNRRHPERRIQSRPAPDQVAAEIRQSLKALAEIAALLAVGLAAQAYGWTMAPLALSLSAPWTWLQGVGLLILSLLLYDAWFYWGHRLMHWKPLYRFHQLHHQSIVPTPWANNRDTLLGTFVEQSYFLILPFVLPIPAGLIIVHKIFDQVTGMIGHAGHEYFASPTARRPWPLLATTFHDQHHGYFHYNFANTFSIWDRMMGTLHPSYDRTVEHFEQP